MSENYGSRLDRLFSGAVKRIFRGRSNGALPATRRDGKFNISDPEPAFVRIVLYDFGEQYAQHKQCIYCKYAAVRGQTLELTECRNPRSPCHGRFSLISEGFGCLFHRPHMCGMIPGIKEPVAKQGDDDGISGDGDGTE
jgi:hypothetical protein